MANVKDLLVNGSARVIGTIYGNATSANKVNHSLTFGSKSFNGSSAQTITLADLGGKPTQSAVSSPSASGTAISFIDTISQNANGVITATKKTVRDASASQSGVVSTGAQTFAGIKTFNNTLNSEDNIWLATDKFIGFKGVGQSTSIRTQIGYANKCWSGAEMHSHGSGGANNTGAFYIQTNGYTATNDIGGLAIDNEGVTIFGAGDQGDNFTGVFRVINEDAPGNGPMFNVKKTGDTFIYKSLGINGTNTTYQLYVNGTSYFNGDISRVGNISPLADNSKNLGSSSLKWANIYATTFNGDLNGTATHFENNAFRTKRDFVNGTLITTDLSIGTSNIPFYLEIVGNGYGNGLIAAYCQGYSYDLSNHTQCINCDAYSTGKSFANTIYAFGDTNGKLCFWFARMAYWQGFDITVFDTSERSNTKKLTNHVVSVSDVALPETRNWETQITVRQASFVGTGSTDSRYVLKSGDTLTGTLNTQIVQPKANATYNLGGASNRWATLYSTTIDNSGDYIWYGGKNFRLMAMANGQEWSFDQGYSPTSYTGTYSQFWSSKNGVSIIRFYTDDNQVMIPSTGFMGIGGTGNSNYKLTITGKQYIQSASDVGTTSGLTINNGVLAITNYGQTLTVGALNTSWTHFHTSGSQFYFNKQIHIEGNLTRFNYSSAGYGTINGYNLAGNAATATKLATARTISLTGAVTGSGTFDGSGNLSISTTTNHNHDSSYLSYSGAWSSGSGQNVDDASGMIFAYSNHGMPGSSWGVVTTFEASKDSAYRHQIYGDGWNNEMYFRTRSANRHGWNGWRHLLDGNNYTSYTVTKTGSGASGTWGISISGNAATASLLKNVGSNCTASASTWNNGRGGTIVWGERWTSTNYTYTPSGGSATTITDSGDITLYVKAGSTTSNALTLNMAIDGEIYAGGGFVGNISGNATSATKLQTARTIWGQSFNGTANISGNMTGVGNINTAAAPAGTIYMNNWFRSTGKTGWYNETYGGGLYMSDSTYIRNYAGKTTRLDNLCLGTDNNSYRLYVDGTTYVTSQIKSSNSWISIAGTSSFTCPDGTAITQPGGSNPLVLYSGAASGRDCGIFYLSNDNAYVANSSDTGYTFGVFDTDITQNFSTESNASLCVRSGGAGTFIRSRLGVNGINDSYNLCVKGASYLDGKTYINTNTNTTPLYITRAGSETEAVAMSVDDSTYTIAYTNDEKFNQIRFRLINTDTEDGTKDNTTDSSIYLNSSYEFYPEGNNVGSIGLSSRKWSNIYATTFHGALDGNAATSSKVNNKLTVGSKTYDGSASVTIAASDLGLASAMLFLGTTTTAITDGAKTNPVAIGGSNKTVTAGNVVLYGSKEFVWTGSAWEELGNEGSYKIVQAAVADPSASGTSNTFIATISQDANGKITATKKTVAVTNSAPTLAWGTTSTIGTVAGTNLQVKMPANPNTWRGIQNNLTSDSTTDSLSAAQGKALKALIDGKAASSHTHNYLPLSGGTLTGTLELSNGANLDLKPPSSGNDSGDIVFYYSNGNEKMRIWSNNDYSGYYGPNFRLYKEDGTYLGGSHLWAAGESITGAVWNDYAEYREADTIQGGRCVREVGDDTLTLTTKRLMRGCSITSDTWGFAQGETDKAKTPIAVAGRVLAYPLEDRELFKEYIGYSVCSGPNGTVSLMTEEEELKYPWAIIGTVSAIPDYEEWGGGEMADRPSVKVDGRIWIKVK